MRATIQPKEVIVKQRPLIGILGVVGMSLGASISSPLVSILKAFRVGELMMIRAGMMIIFMLVIMRITGKRIWLKPPKRLLIATALIGNSTLCMYEAFRVWQTGPAVVLLTTMPVAVFILRRLRGQSVKRSAMICLVFLLGGVALAQEFWLYQANIPGIVWILGAIVSCTSAIALFENNGVDPWTQTLWLGITMALMGFVACVIDGVFPFSGIVVDTNTALLLLTFGVAGGWIYFTAFILLYANLRSDVAAVLSQAETPCVLAGAAILLNEPVSPTRIIGVIIALSTSAVLGRLESSPPNPQSPTP